MLMKLFVKRSAKLALALLFLCRLNAQFYRTIIKIQDYELSNYVSVETPHILWNSYFSL
jgi:hypothetical protein